uniref:Myoneurin n=1 Tax=Phallusia mammillata TaxID=59560 RepID=A0A6F9DME8_9ASCI|nr:myoneurin [Phallusia mammillata]
MRQHLQSENFIQLSLKLKSTTIFQDVLEFLYTGEIVLTNENIAEVTMLGSYLKINDLTRLTVQYLNGMQAKGSLASQKSPSVQVIVHEGKSLNPFNQKFTVKDGRLATWQTPIKKIKTESYQSMQTLNLNSKVLLLSERKTDDEREDFDDLEPAFEDDTLMQSDNDSLPIHESPMSVSSFYFKSIIPQASGISDRHAVNESLSSNEQIEPNKIELEPEVELTMKGSLLLKEQFMSEPYLTMMDISNGLLFKCDICLETFCNFDLFKEHRMLSHELEETPKCWICGEQFDSGNDLALHVHVHYFEKGDKIFRTITQSVEANIFPCLMCSEQFSKHKDLQQHLETSHEEDWPFTCTKCGVTFEHNQALGLSLHILSLHAKRKKQSAYFSESQRNEKDKEYLCTDCGLIYTSKEIYEEHVESKCTQRGHVCQICSRSFTRPQLLRRHLTLPRFSCGEELKKWRKDNNKINVTEVLPRQNPVPGYLCGDCDSGFQKFNEFNTHRLEKHNASEEPKCRFCDLVISDEKKLDKHVSIHVASKTSARTKRRHPSLTEDGKWTCIVCEAVFELESDYRFHKTLRCALKCRFCNFSSGKKQRLRQHVSGHLRVLPFPCLKCDKAFSWRQSLLNHMHTQHAVESVINLDDSI